MMITKLCLIALIILCVGATHLHPRSLFFIITFFFSYILSQLFAGNIAWRRGCLDRLPPSIPGPFGWPFIGCIPIFMGPVAHRRLAKLSSSLGAKRLMAFSLGTRRVVISSHIETAKEILSGPSFVDRPAKISAQLLMFDRAIGFSPSGEYWRHLRRLVATNMFSPRRIAASEGLREQVVGNMMDQIGVLMGKRGVVELRGVLQRGALESVVGSVVGSVGLVEWEEMIVIVREGYELIGTFNLEDYFPCGGWLDFHGVGKRSSSLAIRVRELFGGIIERRRSDEVCMGEDFLGVLLSLPKHESLSHSDMIAVLWELIFRGADVVATLLEWIMARMVLHPEVQAQAQQEIDLCVGRVRPVKDFDMPNLRYLQALVKEVLRLHPPGPLLSWARLAITDVNIDKHFIPAGTTAMVNIWAIAHDGSVWKDPWTFRPERFLEEEVSVMGSDLRLAPFGSGRRVCPGRALGLATVHLWLARLLQKYTWEVNKRVQLSECLRLSLEMRKPLVCRAVHRDVMLDAD